MNYLPDAPKFYGILAVILLGLAIWHGIDGWVAQERWLERYPDFPAAWHDMGLREFYAYNRWTAVILGLGALFCAVVSLHSRVALTRGEGDVLDQLAAARRHRNK